MSISDVVPSLSPSMDIQVSSNFERLLFDLLQRDGTRVGEAISQFRASGRLPEGARLREAARNLFDGYRVDDDETLSVIADIHASTGMLIDPHTAVALGAARKAPDEGVKRIVLSTAHPAKFPDAVEKATGIRPALPEHMADLFDRPERVERLPNELAAVGRYVRDVATARQAA